MIITFKTLEQKTFKLEIDESETVLVLKQKIEEDRKTGYPVAGQKLIYSGKILDDDKLISEYKIDPVKNFVVVMVVKPKSKVTEKPKETETSTSQSSASSEPTSMETSDSGATASTNESNLSAVATPSTPSDTPASVTQNTVESAESTLLTGSALESSITELMSLGFSREQVMRALNSSFHNADRAAEYLLSGNIPDSQEESEDMSTAPAAGNSPAPTASDLHFLRNLPQFQLMRQQVQTNPGSLPQLLQQIGRSNPELLSVISQHQEEFIALLNETGSSDGGESNTLASAGAHGGSDGGQSLQIQVTPSEKEAIERMVAMGFAESEVIQAFFACDKNEQLAIELLLKD